MSVGLPNDRTTGLSDYLVTTGPLDYSRDVRLYIIGLTLSPIRHLRDCRTTGPSDYFPIEISIDV